MIWPDHGIKPPSITSCKRTYINAWGRAEASDLNATKAVRDALAAARTQIALAVTDARALTCTSAPCSTGCRQGRIVRVGSGIDRNVPTKKAGLWVARAWGFESFERYCSCVES
jgi:hypothetical protein